MYYWRFTFATRPLKVLDSYEWVLALHSGPWKEQRRCNWVLEGAAGGSPVEFRRGPAAGSAGDGRGAVQGCLRLGFGSWLGRW
jgi:hypothetical protein